MYLLELNEERDWDFPRRVLDMIYLISERRRHEIVALLPGKGTRGLRLSHIMTVSNASQKFSIETRHYSHKLKISQKFQSTEQHNNRFCYVVFLLIVLLPPNVLRHDYEELKQ